MKDGYYLSIYTHIDELVHLKEIDLRHDHHMALWEKKHEDIELIHFWEFERISGRKHHNQSFYNVEHACDVINELLSVYDISLDDIVEIWGTPKLETSADYHTLDEYPEYAYHSLAHLFSTILLDTDKFYNSQMIALAVDGGPDNVIDYFAREKDFYMGAYCDCGKIKLFSVPSPGLLWMLMKLRYKLEEGSLMALGSASTSKCTIPIEEFMEGLVSIKKLNDIFPTSEWLNQVAKRIECITAVDQDSLFNGFDDRFSEKENRISMVVKVIQEISIKMIENTVEQIITEYDVEPTETYLALAGGYALNCPSNSYLMDKFNFKGFIAPPCVSDTGIALGMGLYAFYKKLGRFNFKFKNAFYGDDHTDVEEILRSEVYSGYIQSISSLDYSQLIRDLQNQPIIWFNGRAEIGPRALGNRSILADPRNLNLKDNLNEIKKRQWWRPVAPIILEEYVEDWFQNGRPSPYMLETFTVKDDKKDVIPAILHLDQSARIQTVNKDENPDIYQIIKEFYKQTGVPIICNTSLNDKGEPIINRAEEVLNLALRKGVAVVYINKMRIELKNFTQFPATKPEKRMDKFCNYLSKEAREARLKELNPFGLFDRDLIFYFNNPDLCRYDLRIEKDVKTILKIIERIKGKMLHDIELETAW
ncbi:MAG: hypothetical protein KAX49_02945 [Halanaerobiales bacterium]|nr:hypothetical protein [Halanaerobiales bacterium]